MIATVKDDFWMVFVEDKNIPAIKYFSMKEAMEESKRLCEEEGRPSYVLRAFYGYYTTSKPFHIVARRQIDN
jgi:hypothetical protein